METDRVKTPWHLWVVGVLGVLWNLIGVVDFSATVTKFEPYMSNFPQEALDYYYSMPVWSFVVWGIAVWAALIGCVLILMRKSMAVAFLGASLGAALISFGHGMINPAPEGLGNPIMMIAIIGLAVGFLVYALWLSRRNVLS
ncbi:MAG: hypothetical protein ACRBEQ_04225 [Hyphomonas sp.]